MKTYSVKYSDQAKYSLKAIHSHLMLVASPATAHKVRNNLVALANGLSTNPRRHAVDALFSYNNFEVRSIHKWKYKILYTVEEETVLILRFFHSSQNPKSIDLE